MAGDGGGVSLRIDAHQHFWEYETAAFGWITDDMAAIRRSFLPQDLEPRLRATGFDGCIAVQAPQTEQETEWLLSLSEKADFIRGVVGWVDLCAENVGERLDHFVKHPRFRGVRHIVQAEPECFMQGAAFRSGLRALTARNLTYDILVYPHQLGEAIELVDALPNQKFVLDHLGKPRIGDDSGEWSELILELAKRENVWAKLSGLVTEANWKSWHPADFSFYLDYALEAFGPKRLMFGSDWPVCLVAAHYSDVVNLVEEHVSETEHVAIFGETAAAFYAVT